MAQSGSTSNKDCLKYLPHHLSVSGAFLIDIADMLNWGDLSTETITDIGCGMNSYALFRAIFPHLQKLIALDISLTYIKYLENSNHHNGIEYHLADITDRSTLTAWKGQMSKIVSYFCFNCLKDQRAGFENIHYLLRPGGEAVIVTALKNPHYECGNYLLSQKKWKLYQHLEKQYTDYQAHGTGIKFYEKILREINFEIIACEEEHRFHSFSTEQEFRESVLTQDKVIERNLPPIERLNFRSDYMLTLMELNGFTANGELCLKTSTARIVIRKK